VTVITLTTGDKEETQALATGSGMNIHIYTSLYISGNEVESRLGTYT
jgi:hypothetical protein